VKLLEHFAIPLDVEDQGSIHRRSNQFGTKHAGTASIIRPQPRQVKNSL